MDSVERCNVPFIHRNLCGTQLHLLKSIGPSVQFVQDAALHPALDISEACQRVCAHDT